MPYIKSQLLWGTKGGHRHISEYLMNNTNPYKLNMATEARRINLDYTVCIEDMARAEACSGPASGLKCGGKSPRVRMSV